MRALKVLEFPLILERISSLCETTLGCDLALSLAPSFEEASVWELNAETAEAIELLGSDPPPSLGKVADLRSALDRGAKGGVLGGEELFAIGEMLWALRACKAHLRGKSGSCPRLWSYAEFFPEARALEERLQASLEPNGDVRESASVLLGQLRRRKHQAGSKIIERIQSYVSGKTREYLSDPLYTVRDGRYVLPVKSEHRAKIRGIVHDSSSTGHTVYIEPEDVLKLGNELRQIEGEEKEEVARILAELSAEVGGVAPEAMPAIESAGRLDLIFAKGRFGYATNGSIPSRARKPSCLRLEGARHPLIDPKAVVAIDVEIGYDFDGLLITGPNTGGKTVAIKCVGLFVAMAQAGIPISSKRSELGVFSQLWADIGDEQSIAQSLSTFSGHIKNIAEALNGVRDGALVLFDELGAGTDPAEGAALARAIMRSFRLKGAKLLASSHYGELKAFAYSEPGFMNAAMEFDTKTLQPTYRLVIGLPGASQAMRIAERYGMPREVIDAAKAAMGEQQQNVAEMLEKLDQAQRAARKAQGEADRLTAELKQKEALTEQKLAEVSEIRRTASERARGEMEEALRQIRVEAAELFDRIKAAGGDSKEVQGLRTELKALEESARSGLPQEGRALPSEQSDIPVEKGASVRVEGYSQIGVVLDDPKDGKVQVQMGMLKLTIPVSKLAATKPPSERRTPTKKGPNLNLERAQTAQSEISLRGMRAEDAMQDLERFVDDAVLGGIHRLRIVHGKGEGILRNLVHAYLKKRKEVDSFKLAEAGEGGDGVTVAYMK